MTKKRKLMFDECVGKPILEALAAFQRQSDHEFELEHVLDKRKQGIWDEVWIPQLNPREWVVITGDRGKGGQKKGQKLPKVCEDNGITHIALGPSVHNLKTEKKIVAIESVWGEIARLFEVAPGAAYLLSMAGGSAKLTLKVQKAKGAKKKPKGKSP